MGQSLGLVAASSSPLANKWPGPEQRDTTRTFQGPSFRGYIRRAYCVWVLDRATMAARYRSGVKEDGNSPPSPGTQGSAN